MTALTLERAKARVKLNTVELRASMVAWAAACSSASQPVMEGTQVQIVTVAVGDARQAAGPPGSDVLEPSRAAVGLGRCPSSSLCRRHGRGGDRRCVTTLRSSGGSHDPDVLRVAKDLPRWRARARLGGKAAHLALDHPRVVPATAALGRHRRDLDQDQLKHAAPPVRGKTQHGTADAAGRCAPCG